MRSLSPIRIILAILLVISGFTLLDGTLNHDAVIRAAASTIALLSLCGLLLFPSQLPSGRSASDGSADLHAQLSRMQQQLLEQERHLDRIEGQLPSLLGSGPSLPTQTDYGPKFDQLAVAIRELREYALLPDTERRQRLAAHRQERKTVLLAEVNRLVAAHDWPGGERLLLSLSSEFPNDDEVTKARHYLDHTRSLFAGETIAKSTAAIEESLASGNTERALDQARALATGFPTRGDIQSLLSRVQREHAVATEATTKRLFDDIRRASDERQWCTALEIAQRLLQKFPHPPPR